MNPRPGEEEIREQQAPANWDDSGPLSVQLAAALKTRRCSQGMPFAVVSLFVSFSK
jgi:hypothetical protein